MWPRKVMVRSWCVHCILYSRINLADFMFLLYISHTVERVLGFFSSRPNRDSSDPSTAGECVPPSFGQTRLRVRGSLYGFDVTAVKWPYGVKKISIKWLWPVKATLKVIKRRQQVFCWSCDGVPLKWNKKNSRASSLSLRIKWAHSRLSVRMIGQYL